ncbi:MAG: hypothetical protein WC821_02810 [archaeon]|jgi:type II secretory pathway pseudopilin PulG
MKKGQISLDLMITLIVVLIVISSLSLLIFNFKSSQEKTLIEQQLSESSQKTASFITTLQTMSDTNFYAELKINKIQYEDEKGNLKKVYPIITVFDANKIQFLVTVTTKTGGFYTVDSNSYFSKNTDMNIVLTDVPHTGILVIKNA